MKAALGMLVLAGCSGGEVPSDTVHHTLESMSVVTVAPDLVEAMPLEHFDEATRIWCEGTEGRFCPTFRQAGEDELPDIFFGEREGAPLWGMAYGTSIRLYYAGRIIVNRNRLDPECMGYNVAHELGHAIGLEFDNPDDPEHSATSEGRALMWHTYKRSWCSGYDLDYHTWNAFNQLMSDSVGTGPE